MAAWCQLRIARQNVAPEDPTNFLENSLDRGKNLAHNYE